MRVDTILGNIGSSGGIPSLGESYLRAYVRKEITAEEHYISNAVLVADNLAWYLPLEYQPLPQQLFNYAEQRVAGGMERDAGLAKRLGEWFYTTQRRLTENAANLQLLLWSHEYCGRVKLTEKMAKLERMIEAFGRLIPPVRELEAAAAAKKRDADVRARQGI